MRVDTSTGLLVGVKQVLSPYFDARPVGRAAGSHRAARNLACHRENSAVPGSRACSPATCPPRAHPEFRERAGLRVSAHLLVRRDGGLVQFVSFNDRAWHAGRSAWQGREACNDYSIGIECEGTDETPYEAGAVRRRCASCCRCC